MKKIFLLAAIVVSLSAAAQVRHVSLKASGLTCSMCSNSIYKALKTLDFIQTVDADIKTYMFEISFKPGYDIDFDLIRKKIEDAGFSVSGFFVSVEFNNQHVEAGKPFAFGNKTLLFSRLNISTLNGIHRIQILDKGFVSPKEYKRSGIQQQVSGSYNVTL